MTSAAPRALFRPLEAEVATLDLAHRLSIKPEHDALDVVCCKVVAQTIEGSRAVANHIRAMSDELFKSRRDFGRYVLPVPFVERALEHQQARNRPNTAF